MNNAIAAQETTSLRRPEEYASDQDVRWCPGCGDYSVLAQLKKALAATGRDPDSIAVISGIGCSSRLPYYLGTYGVHGIHGRAPAIATGLKLARPDVQVWVATGDGDGLSIGANHLVHTMRRNTDLKVLLFNNRIYGLTKGQLSPTSEFGKRTVSTPYGAVNQPLNPIAFALGCDATFVARTVDRLPKHLTETLERAAAHRGLAFVEIYQNCNIFNDGAFDYAHARELREDSIIELEHGQPLRFGRQRDKGLRLSRSFELEVVTLGQDGVREADLLVHDAHQADPGLAFLLARLRHPAYPEPIGIFRDVEQPSFTYQLREQVDALRGRAGQADLQSLLMGPDSWVVE